MPIAAFVVPGHLHARTGGYQYDRHVINGLRQRGWSLQVIEVQGQFPRADAATADAMRAAFATIPDGLAVIVDGLGFSAVPDVIQDESQRLRFVPIVHMPLADELGLDMEVRHDLEARERRALQAATLVIVTGESTRHTLIGYGVVPERIVVIEPGTAIGPLARGSVGGRLELLCVATLNLGKGHALLIDALAAVPHHEWHLTCAGSLTRDPATVAHVRQKIAEHQLTQQVTLAGELAGEELGRAYDRADLFVLPTLRETFGMAVAEALAHGVPVISTRTGAIPRLVGADAGLLIDPGDRAGLEHALIAAMSDVDLRLRLSAAAHRVREQLPSWDTSLDKIASALEQLHA